ncbi:hypothetical protein BP6252_04987 [Coleophoma cylindrospora]|uniref:Carboxylic ester hydrolase n=1 Tax=Coleophoma cylindrospora TaxID=1849047 RepID=A0A3D8RST3_9HELO|nr:hypothetical protein BP6252_04987 [Coleophoma cylindrospora]
MAELPRFISTADVPAKYLADVKLVGSVPFKALKSEPRTSYTLYIPPEHYNPDPSRQLLLKDDKTNTDLDPIYHLPPLPLLVNIHGTSRSAERCRNSLEEFSHKERVAILAPLFPAGIDGYNHLENYQLLNYKALRFDLALLSMLDEVALRWPGIATQKVYLMGFSAGGQFVHRFMYLHSDRLLAASVGAPGAVTLLDKSLTWPRGIRNLSEVFGADAVVDIPSLKQLPIQLVVGSADNFVYGAEGFWKWVSEKKTKLANEQDEVKGSAPKLASEPRKGRWDSLADLQLTLRKDGIPTTLNVVEGVKHDSMGVLSAVQSFFRPLLQTMPRG